MSVMKTTLFLIIAFSFLIGANSTIFSQERLLNDSSFRHFVGYVKDSENKPFEGATVCGWDKSGRPINGRIPCVRTESDGKFNLSLMKWDGDDYRLWVFDIDKGYPDAWGFLSSIYESFLFENRAIDVNRLNESKLIEFRLNGIRAGKMTLKIVDDINGKTVEKGLIKLCRLDDQNACSSISTSFPNGVYEFLTPQSAFTIRIQLWNGSEWIDRKVLDENRREIETLQVELGKSESIKIRLRK
jgi:hypothetical protein